MKQITICFFVFLAISACENKTGIQNPEIKTGVLSLQMDVQRIPSEVVKIEGSLSRVDFESIYFDFEVAEQSASQLIEYIAIGVWTVKIDAYNDAGDIIYSATTDVLVVANLVTPVYIHLMKTGSVEIIVTWGDDRFEDNDYLEDAAALWEYHYFEDLYVSADDEDWYSISLSADSISITCDFIHKNGDINLDIVDGNGNILRSALSETDNEALSYTVKQLGTYYIHVYSLSEKSNSYTLWWDDIWSGEYTYDPRGQVYIPDQEFLNALIEKGVDSNRDNLISYVEAEAVTSLVIPYRNISDLTGIEAFINMETLDCSFNLYSSIDVSTMPGLIYLDCSESKLTSLDVSNNTLLRHLDCSDYQIPSLDVTNNPHLTYLNCHNNLITSLDLRNNVHLELLWTQENQLSSLDISQNTSLIEISLHSIPTLQKVCVWTLPFPPAGVHVDSWQSPNIVYTTDCNK
ncbi:MAG: pre-peptidase C-terminal domain-containing protein [Bacteroidota bacterium]